MDSIADGIESSIARLAVFLSQGPWSFDVRLVAPTWVERQVRWDGPENSDGAQGELIQCSVRCGSITPRVPALSPVRLRAPPRHATSWRRHDEAAVQYKRANDIQRVESAKRNVRSTI